jgi:hypothetical protein
LAIEAIEQIVAPASEGLERAGQVERGGQLQADGVALLKGPDRVQAVAAFIVVP